MAICIEKSIKFNSINLSEIKDLCREFDINICAIKFCFGNKIGHLVTIYFPPNNNIFRHMNNFWHIILQHLSALPNLILCGDFNSKHSAWCKNTINYKNSGFLLYDAIVQTDLVLINDGSPTWISSDHSSFSSIDLNFSKINFNFS